MTVPRVHRRTIAVVAVAAALGTGSLGSPAAAAVSWDAPGWGWTVRPDGTSYTSPHGDFTVPAVEPAAFTRAHGEVGGGRGLLGYPTTTIGEENVRSAGSDVVGPGSFQIFERGVVYTALGGPAIAVREGTSPIGRLHRAWGGGGGLLGYPVTPEIREGGYHWFQAFGSGTIYVSPAGTYAVPWALDEGHRTRGGGTGALGYPVAGHSRSGGVWTQAFERGRLECTEPLFGPPIGGAPTCRTL